MANWFSVKSAAEKYGIPEEQIHEWIRLKYLRSSSVDKEPYEDSNPMVDTDEIDKALELNSLKSYPDDAGMERVTKEHLNWLYQENARLEKANDDLMEANYLRTQHEAILKNNLDQMNELTNKIMNLNDTLMNCCENIVNKKGGIWIILYRLFILKRNKALI